MARASRFCWALVWRLAVAARKVAASSRILRRWALESPGGASLVRGAWSLVDLGLLGLGVVTGMTQRIKDEG